MKISVIGLGKLGLPMAAVFASKGHDVVGVDSNGPTVESLNNGSVPIREPGLENLLQKNAEKISFTSNLSQSVKASDISFLVVPTPSKPDGAYSLEFLESLCEELSGAINDKNSYHLVVVCSTVSPGDSARLEKILSSHVSDQGLVGYCYSPEFVALGTAVKDFQSAEMYLIGESRAKDGELLEEFFRSIALPHAPIYRMSTYSAEIAKIALNSFITLKISFANMIADFCEVFPETLVDTITQAIGTDSRIGGKYLKGGLPFGGPCFPRDNRALIKASEAGNIDTSLLEAIDNFNSGRRHKLVKLISRRLGTRTTMLVAGIAYKSGSNVTEESAALEMALEFQRMGLRVYGFEPSGMLSGDEIEDLGLEAVPSLEEGIERSEVLLVSAPPEFFTEVDLERICRSREDKLLVIDFWRSLAGWELEDCVDYLAIGKSLN